MPGHDSHFVFLVAPSPPPHTSSRVRLLGTRPAFRGSVRGGPRPASRALPTRVSFLNGRGEQRAAWEYACPRSGIGEQLGVPWASGAGYGCFGLPGLDPMSCEAAVDRCIRDTRAGTAGSTRRRATPTNTAPTALSATRLPRTTEGARDKSCSCTMAGDEQRPRLRLRYLHSVKVKASLPGAGPHPYTVRRWKHGATGGLHSEHFSSDATKTRPTHSTDLYARTRNAMPPRIWSPPAPPPLRHTLVQVADTCAGRTIGYRYI